MNRHCALLIALAVPLCFVHMPGCTDTRYYEDLIPNTETAQSDSDTGRSTEDNSSDPVDCPSTLAERLTLYEVDVDDNIHYLQPGYNLIPVAARVILAREPDGKPIVAWLNGSMETIHVTPLDADYSRREDDVQLSGVDLGGLVAHNDGFAILTRRPDTGEPLAVEEQDSPTQRAVLVRYQNRRERFALPLTGTDSFDGEREYSNYLRGRLEWNGEKYGAYFEIRAGLGADREGTYGDKLVYVDDNGIPLSGGWRFATGTLTGIGLCAETYDFTALALPDGQPDSGLVLLRDPDHPVTLANEETWNGYSGGLLGDIVKLPSGEYAVAWASRGYDASSEEAEQEAHDVAFLRLSSDHSPRGEIRWLTRTNDIDETSVHIAPYGPERLLVLWNAVDNLDCRERGTCFGMYVGTYFQLFSVEGEPMGEKEMLPAPPTLEPSIVRFDNGDLAYAFVTDSPDYSERFDTLYRDSPPPMQTLQIAHLDYCGR